MVGWADYMNHNDDHSQNMQAISRIPLCQRHSSIALWNYIQNNNAYLSHFWKANPQFYDWSYENVSCIYRLCTICCKTMQLRYAVYFEMLIHKIGSSLEVKFGRHEYICTHIFSDSIHQIRSKLLALISFHLFTPIFQHFEYIKIR